MGVHVVRVSVDLSRVGNYVNWSFPPLSLSLLVGVLGFLPFFFPSPFLFRVLIFRALLIRM
jgi:hypothetical protein